MDCTLYTTCAGLGWRVPRSKKTTPETRFWSKVNKDGPVHPELGTPCWFWTASLLPSGYGQFDGCRSHRVSWEVVNGPILDGLDVCHKCDTPKCVNPDHLFLGTAAENAADMVIKGRWSGPTLSQTPWGEARSRLSAEQVAEIRAACGTQKEIAEQFGIGQPTVSRIRAAKRWGRLDGDVPGQVRASRGRPHAKLSPEQVQSIRLGASLGTSRKSLAVQYSVSITTIADIVRGKSWG